MSWTQRVRKVKLETYALYLACRDPRTPWFAKAFGGLIVTYALSPIDLIPDFIPLIGYLDDLLVVSIGVLLVRNMIPRPVLEACRNRAASELPDQLPRLKYGLIIVLGTWLLVLGLVMYAVLAKTFR